jgi:carbon monoxide dehydrogenase subunit G
MPQFSDSIDIKRPPEDVWRGISTPERWFEGYLETRSRSAEYPGPDTRDDHLFRTRMKEEVKARVTRSEAPSVLEEDQEGRTFSRHVRYSLDPSNGGTLVRVVDRVDFKGLGKLAAPIASRDIRKRWDASLHKLKEAVEEREEERR